MRKRTRYLLIGFGFIIFGVLAPSIVFYVRGLKIDTEGRRALETGIITVNSNPEGAEVFLNEQKKGSTPESYRFLIPGDYNVLVKKPGYRTWEKRLTVLPGKVTSATESIEKLFLFKEASTPTSIDDGVNNFVLVKNYLVYLGQNSLIRTTLDNLSQKELTSIPSAQYSFKVSQNEDYIILFSKNNTYWYSPSSNKLVNITNMTKESDEVEVLNSGKIVVKFNQNIYLFTAGSKNRNRLMENVKGFGVLGNTVYALKDRSPETDLVLLDTDIENPTPQEIIPNLREVPDNSKIFVNNQKFVAIYSAGNLYRLNDGIKKTLGEVVNVNLNPNTNQLVVTTKGELVLVDMANGQNQLISRSTEQFYSNVYRPEIGYIFTATAGEVKAIELDDRDRSNIYNFGTADSNTKIAINENNQKLFILSLNKLSQFDLH